MPTELPGKMAHHRSSIVISPGLSSEGGEGEEQGQKEVDECGDYLADPALWWDPLPQPYRLIDDILQEELRELWSLLEIREEKRKEEEKTNKPIRKTEEAIMIPGLLGATRLEQLVCGEKEYLLAGLGGDSGLVSLDYKKNDLISTPMEGRVTSISAQIIQQQRQPSAAAAKRGGGGGSGGGDKNVLGGSVGGEQKEESACLLVAVSSGEGGGQILLTKDNQFYSIVELEGMDRVLKVLLSTGGNYLAVTGLVNSNDSPVLINVYSLPVDAWLQQVGGDQESYSKPSLLCSITSPPPFTHCPVNDATQIIKQFPDRPSSSLFTGVSHGLTKSYMNIRSSQFQERRKGFLPEPNEESSVVGKEIGACMSFMHYWKGQYYNLPKGLLVHWQYFSRVDVYLFQDKVKAPPTLSVPDQVYIQPYLVSSVSLSSDCSFLAIGQCPGLLSLFDLSATIGSFWGVINIAPVSITALYFVNCVPSHKAEIIVGCKDGSVVHAKWAGPGRPTITKLTEGYRVSGPVYELKQNTSLPSTITSLHGGESQLIMWDIDKGEAIGSFCLPPSYSLLSDPKGTLATGSDVTAVIAKMEDTEEVGVFSWNLSSCEALRKTWLKSDSKPSSTEKLSAGPNRNKRSVYEELLSLISTEQ